jgi:hypothetical protein
MACFEDLEMNDNGNSTNYYDVYGHLPAMYNRKFDTMVSVQREKLSIKERFDLSNTLHGKGGGERPKTEVKRMKVMAIVFYALSFAGVFMQATNIVPGIPDRVTFSAIVGGLVAANLMQWHQAIKDREQNRKSLEEMVDRHQDEMKHIQETMMNIFREMKK